MGSRVASIGLVQALVLTLAGCSGGGGPQPEAQLAIQGLQAFQAGDAGALQAAQDGLAKLYTAAPVPFPNPCTAEDYAQRRQAAFTGLLANLKREAQSASSDEDRYQRLQRLILDSAPGAEQPNSSTCAPSADRALLAASDTAERLTVLKAEHDILVSWAAKLGHPIQER